MFNTCLIHVNNIDCLTGKKTNLTSFASSVNLAPNMVEVGNKISRSTRPDYTKIIFNQTSEIPALDFMLFKSFQYKQDFILSSSCQINCSWHFKKRRVFNDKERLRLLGYQIHSWESQNFITIKKYQLFVCSLTPCETCKCKFIFKQRATQKHCSKQPYNLARNWMKIKKKELNKKRLKIHILKVDIHIQRCLWKPEI